MSLGDPFFLEQALVLRTRSEETPPRAGGHARSRRSNKPPSFQHKLLHASKFDGIIRIIPSSYYQSFGHFIPQNPTYHPVPRVHIKEGPRRPHSSGNHVVDLSPFPDADASADAEGGSNIIDDTQDKTSTFIPYIGPSEFATSTTVCWNAWILCSFYAVELMGFIKVMANHHIPINFRLKGSYHPFRDFLSNSGTTLMRFVRLRDWQKSMMPKIR
jgi:hypothetical protein